MRHSLELFEQPIPVLRPLQPEDGAAVLRLAKGIDQTALGGLLCKLIEFDDYRKCSTIAELDRECVGALMAYVLPYDPETVFVWRVDVAEGEVDKGLAALMLGQLMQHDACSDVHRVQTVIQSNDQCNWEVFRRFARWQRSRLDIQPFIPQVLTRFRGQEISNLVTIQLRDQSSLAA